MVWYSLVWFGVVWFDRASSNRYILVCKFGNNYHPVCQHPHYFDCYTNSETRISRTMQKTVQFGMHLLVLITVFLEQWWNAPVCKTRMHSYKTVIVGLKWKKCIFGALTILSIKWGQKTVREFSCFLTCYCSFGLFKFFFALLCFG